MALLEVFCGPGAVFCLFSGPEVVWGAVGCFLCFSGLMPILFQNSGLVVLIAEQIPLKRSRARNLFKSALRCKLSEKGPHVLGRAQMCWKGRFVSF